MNSVLIIRGGAIGDFVLTLPAIHAVRDQFSKARIEIMGYSHIAQLAENRFYADAIRSMDSRAVAGFFAHRGKLDPELSQYFGSFDLVVSYLYDPDSIFLNNLQRAGATEIIPANCKPSDSMHATEFLAQWLPQAGVPPHIQPPKLYPSDFDSKAISNLIDSTKRPVALHIGSGSSAKNWPITNFLKLASWLKSQGFPVVILDGPADSEVQNLFWKDSSAEGCIRCHDQSLTSIAALLQRCQAFVGHDSGISHIAAAVGIPTIVLFGPTNARVWGPLGSSVKILQRSHSVSSNTPEDVKTALEPFLKKVEK